MEQIKFQVIKLASANDIASTRNKIRIASSI